MRTKTKLTGRNVSTSVAFLLIVPTLAHLLFSWMGFAPVDDGFTLAYARRILEGQVPHRDFIIIRPSLSPLIHTPFVLFGGDYTYWMSRFFVWFQFACIAWAWVSIVDHAFGNPFNTPTKLFVGLVSFAASVHFFTLTAWHTIDAMFLVSVGVWVLVAQKRSARWRVAGYLLIAAAYLCKQNFLLMAPLCVVLLGDWREIKYWLTIAVPGVAYCAYLLGAGAFPDAVLQLTTQTSVVSVGVLSYLNYEILLGTMAGLCLMFVLSASTLPLLRNGDVPRQIGASALVALPAASAAIGLYRGGLIAVAFGVFGMALGAALYRIWSAATTRDAGEIPIVLVALLLAWSASLSFGYNTPALMLGPLFAILVAYGYSMRESLDPKFVRATLIFMGAVLLLTFGFSRSYYIYREDSANQLTEPVGEVLPGGSLIYTNPDTYRFMAELKSATDDISATDKKYAIIPDVPGWWVQSSQTNPLPIDWPQPVELSDQRLVTRVIEDLEAERGEVVVVVQKGYAYYLFEEFVPLDEDQYPVVRHVRENFRKTSEAEFFELYE